MEGTADYLPQFLEDLFLELSKVHIFFYLHEDCSFLLLFAEFLLQGQILLVKLISNSYFGEDDGFLFPVLFGEMGSEPSLYAGDFVEVELVEG